MKILVTRRIPEDALSILSPHFEIEHHNRPTAIPRAKLLKSVRDLDGMLCLLTEKVDSELLVAAPSLKIVATATVGVDHIDLAACTRKGVAVTHTPGVLTETCADFTWTLLLSAARRIVEGDRLMRSGRFKGWDMLMLLGTDVHGKTLGLVGFGRIGQAVARRAAGFGMRVLYHDKVRVGRETEEMFKAEFAEMDRLLGESDFISLHTVLDSTTRHLIGERELKRMKPSAYLINSARGPIVDEGALVRALKSGALRGAALDVYEGEPRMAPGLARLPNVVLAPHLASASRETRSRMAVLAAESLVDRLIRGRPPVHLANPEVLQVRAV